MRFLFVICFMMAGLAYAEEAPQTKATVSETGESIYMVYGVTGATPVPFRGKADEKEKVLGYFPPNKAVWVIRPQEPWVLVYFKEVTGWVPSKDLITLFTIDPATGIPQ